MMPGAERKKAPVRQQPSLVSKQMKATQKLVRWGDVTLKLTGANEFLAQAFPTSHDANAAVVDRIKSGGIEEVDGDTFVREVEKTQARPIAIGRGRTPEAAMEELLTALRSR
jgi:endonuclease YncB( thermonuclease family)